MLAARGVVEPEPKEPRDRLGAEHVDRLEPGAARSEPDRARRAQQPRSGDELRVELAHGDETGRIGWLAVRLSEREDGLVKLAAGERILRTERGAVRGHDASGDDGGDLRRSPARGGSGLHERLGWRRLDAGGRSCECERGDAGDGKPGESPPHHVSYRTCQDSS